MDGESFRFDLAAASLRADDAERDAALATLAAKLEGALPGACRVKRRRAGLVSRARRVRSIEVELANVRFVLRASGDGVVAERVTHVHDMHRRSERLDLDVWLESLDAELRDLAARSSEARVAIERLLDA